MPPSNLEPGTVAALHRLGSHLVLQCRVELKVMNSEPVSATELVRLFRYELS